MLVGRHPPGLTQRLCPSSAPLHPSKRSSQAEPKYEVGRLLERGNRPVFTRVANLSAKLGHRMRLHHAPLGRHTHGFVRRLRQRGPDRHLIPVIM